MAEPERPMRKLTRGMAWAACCIFAASGCSTPDTPPPSPTPPPRIEKPLDLSTHRDKPCGVVPANPGSQLQLDRLKDYQDMPGDPADGVQPACELSKPPGTSSLLIRLYLSVRPIQAWKNRIDNPRLISVHGYPAAISKIENHNPEAVTACLALVDLADNQGLGVTYNALPPHNVDSCALAQQAAEIVVANLPR